MAGIPTISPFLPKEKWLFHGYSNTLHRSENKKGKYQESDIGTRKKMRVHNQERAHRLRNDSIAKV